MHRDRQRGAMNRHDRFPPTKNVIFFNSFFSFGKNIITGFGYNELADITTTHFSIIIIIIIARAIEVRNTDGLKHMGACIIAFSMAYTTLFLTYWFRSVKNSRTECMYNWTMKKIMVYMR